MCPALAYHSKVEIFKKLSKEDCGAVLAANKCTRQMVAVHSHSTNHFHHGSLTQGEVSVQLTSLY